mgnify:CR=1 FL=1
MLKLGVNIDHIATVRQARKAAAPRPLEGALLAEKAGAWGITAHLREDRRHIQRRDPVEFEDLGGDAFFFQLLRRLQGLVDQDAIGDEDRLGPLSQPDHRLIAGIGGETSLPAPGIPDCHRTIVSNSA